MDKKSIKTKRSVKTTASNGNARFDPVAFLETAAAGRILATHPKKEIVFSQGDVADAVFYIKKGKVKVTVVSREGKEAVVAILGIDEFFGEGCLIGQPKRLSTATTMSECVTMRVDKTEIQRVLRDEPAFSQMFVSHVLARTCCKSRGRPGPTEQLQFDREAACAAVAAAGEFR